MHKVAIVEGDQLLREMYELKLHKSPLHVRSAADGHEGFKLLKFFKPDLVLMDIKLAKLSGIEVIEKYFRHTSGHFPKIILASNYDESVAKTMFSHIEIDRYLVKAHYTPSQIVSVIKELLNTPSGAYSKV